MFAWAIIAEVVQWADIRKMHNFESIHKLESGWKRFAEKSLKKTKSADFVNK